MTALCIGVVKYVNAMNENKTLKVWSSRIPFSIDTMDYDALAHHIHFRSVYSSLVSDYKLGEIRGVLASKWWSNSDKTSWSFKIRDDIFFSDGQKVGARDVALNLCRVAFLMSKTNSASGLLENLKGIESISAADELVEGISFSGDIVTLDFKIPVLDVLQKISFGLYAIVSLKNFDSKTGVWFNKREIIGSGPYFVEKWTDSEVSLRLRTDFPKNLLLSKPINQVVFRHSADEIVNSDLIVDFDDSLGVDKSHEFFGPVKSAIRYVECEGWKDPESICHSEKARKNIRDAFYKYLDSIKFKTIKSFFPLAVKGVSEFVTGDESSVSLSFQPTTFSISAVASAYKSLENTNQVTAQEAFEKAMKYFASQSGLQVDVVTPVAQLPKSASVDFRFRMTAILVDSPHHDIRFMVNSSQGIRLPDASGEIKKYISQENFSAQNVNRLLWDQAIVWPINHMALGLWKRKNSVSLASYNLILPPLDLQWLEWE